MRLAVIHPAFLGDAVFLGPAVRALKARWPRGRVAVVVTPRGEAVARLLPGCDEVLVYDKRGSDGGLRGLWRAGRWLRAFGPDAALVSHVSPRSGALAWLSGAPRRIGYAPWCTERVRLDRSLPFVDRALALAARLGAPAEDRGLRLESPPDPEGHAGRVLAGARRPLVALVPGAEWETKRWGPEKYAVLADEMARRGGTVLLLGGPADRALSARIAELTLADVRDTTGNTIAQALALLARCDLVVGGDTGLTHCARALGRPTLVIFGPTDPARHLFGAAALPLRLGLDCQPCHDHGPRRCPLGHHRCMAHLSARAVADATGQLLLDAPPRAHGVAAAQEEA